MPEPDLDCPKCRLRWPPARLLTFQREPAVRDERGAIVRFGRTVSVPLPQVRCVECKAVYDRPVPN